MSLDCCTTFVIQEDSRQLAGKEHSGNRIAYISEITLFELKYYSLELDFQNVCHIEILTPKIIIDRM